MYSLFCTVARPIHFSISISINTTIRTCWSVPTVSIIYCCIGTSSSTSVSGTRTEQPVEEILQHFMLIL